MTTASAAASERKHEVDFAKALARKGASRFALPFSISGRQRAHERALRTRTLAAVRMLVIQDVTLQVPGELIFGSEPGDCVCVQVDLSRCGTSLFGSVDYLVAQFRPALAIVAAPVGLTTNAAQLVRQTISHIEKNCTAVRHDTLQGWMEVEGCLVDLSDRTVCFM